MNFLELVLRTRLECSSSGTAPATVVGQAGMNARFVNWVAQAWIDIQSSQEYWKWMRQEFSFGVTANEPDYPPFATVGVHANLADFARWYPDTLRLYLTSLGVSDEQYLLHEPNYDLFRNTYRFGTRQTSRPGAFAVRPRDEAILFDVLPDVAYTCIGDYQIKPVLLAADNDIPAVEARFHMLIVYEAILTYGIDQAAAETIARAQKGKVTLMSDFERRYLPEVSL